MNNTVLIKRNIFSHSFLSLPLPPPTLSLPSGDSNGQHAVDGVRSSNRFQYISIHAEGEDVFPYTGAATGDNDFPHLVNLPLSKTFDSVEHLDKWISPTSKVQEAIDAFRPELIIISAGFDAHRNDPIRRHMVGDGDTRGGLTAQDFHALVKMIKTKADKHCMGRLVAVMERGYCCGGGHEGGGGGGRERNGRPPSRRARTPLRKRPFGTASLPRARPWRAGIIGLCKTRRRRVDERRAPISATLAFLLGMESGPETLSRITRRYIIRAQEKNTDDD